MHDSGYAPVSTSAVICVLLGFVSLIAFLALPFIAIAVIAIPLALFARQRIRNYCFNGKKLVIVGLFLSSCSILFSPIWHVACFNSESLPNHSRVDFADMMKSSNDQISHYINKRICLKGYAIPPSRITPMRSFRFSTDGSWNKAENAITVQLPFEWEYEYAPIAVSGVLIFNPDANNPTERYVFQASSIREALTPYGLAQRAPGKGC